MSTPLSRLARRQRDRAPAGRLAGLRARGVEVKAEAAFAEAEGVQERIDGVLDGSEEFTGLNAGGVDAIGLLERVDPGTGTIATDALAPETATQSVEEKSTATIALAGTTPVMIVEKEIVTTGGEVEITVGFFVNIESTNVFAPIYRIWRTTGGSDFNIYQQVIGGNATRDSGGNYNWIQLQTIQWSDAPAAGTHTYWAEIELTANPTSTQEVENPVIRLLEIKR